MFNFLNTPLKLFKKQRGASLLGYGLMVGLVGVTAILAISSIGDGVRTMFNTVGNDLAAVTAPAETATAETPPLPPGTCQDFFDAGFAPGGSSSQSYTANYMRIESRLTSGTFLYFNTFFGGINCDMVNGGTDLRFRRISTASGFKLVRFLHSSFADCSEIRAADCPGTGALGGGSGFHSPQEGSVTLDRLCQELGHSTGTGVIPAATNNSDAQMVWDGSSWNLQPDGNSVTLESVTCSP